jgi:hypothetical protein
MPNGRFRYVPPLDHLRSILACSQHRSELFQEALDSVLLDVAE